MKLGNKLDKLLRPQEYIKTWFTVAEFDAFYPALLQTVAAGGAIVCIRYAGHTCYFNTADLAQALIDVSDTLSAAAAVYPWAEKEPGIPPADWPPDAMDYDVLLTFNQRHLFQRLICCIPPGQRSTYTI